MEHVIRGTLGYLFLLVLFRISGKRTLAEVTTFDFILLLIISEAAQQALLGQDYSFTAAAIVITTLIGLDMLMAWISRRRESAEDAGQCAFSDPKGWKADQGQNGDVRR
jgi:uncharacterized membrane protein YcaP (DUF421 family)